MPLYACCKVNGLTEEKLLRATALSYLICTYIKEYSGKLSAFCGCAIAAGAGMACALCWMHGGDYDAIVRTLNNMAASITGMICDGGNQGCTMKGVAATDAAYRSVEFALNGVYIYGEHSIIGKTPELTMRNMGLIASPGMVGTEQTIVEIFADKLS
jgi:L-cysteine desulfidase